MAGFAKILLVTDLALVRVVDGVKAMRTSPEEGSVVVRPFDAMATIAIPGGLVASQTKGPIVQ